MQAAADPALFPGGTGRRTTGWNLLLLLGPAFMIILLLFGGGLLLGLLQALDHLPGGDLAGIGLGHFRQVLQDPGFARSLGLTLYVATASTLTAALISILLALALTHWAAESRAVNFLLQIPLTVPHLVIAVATILLLAPSGLVARIGPALGLTESASAFPLLINDAWCIGILAVYVWKEIPFITVMLLAVLKNMGPELLEVGSTLNATKLQRFFHITLPIIAPSLGAACLIVFAFTFGAFEVPYLLGRTYPLTLPVWAYKNYSDVDLLARPEGIAIGLIIAVTVCGAIIISQVLLNAGRKRGHCQ